MTQCATASDLVDPALDGLRRAVAGAKGGDPLAPVTVLAPSGYAAVFVRRALGAGSGVDGRRGWANLSCTTLPSLLRMIGSPALAARGLRPAPPVVDLEVIRWHAARAKTWLGPLSSHPSALVELQRALVELRRCPPGTLDAIERGHDRGRDLVGLLGDVRRTLHDCGLADGGDVVGEALRVAGRGLPGMPLPTLGPVLGWKLGAGGAAESDLLGLIGSRPVDDGPARCHDAITELRACADPDEEARRAVRSILAGAEAGTPLWQQAIFHPPGPTYARILHQHLATSGVASNGPGSPPLHRTMTGRALLGLLELADADWPRPEVLGWLSAAPVTAGANGRPVPAARWDVVSAVAGVVRGRRQWHERLGRLAAAGGPEADEAAALVSFMEDLFDRATPPGGTWGAFASWAVGLLDHYLRPDSDPGRWPVEEQAAAQQVRTVVAALADLDRVSPGTDLPSFRGALRTELERTVVDAHPLDDGGFGDGVFVASYAASRGLRVRTVVVVGLADALVPGRSADDGLLDDDLRRMDSSGTLATRSDRREAARRDLLGAVSCGSDERIATFPRGDPRTGRAQVPTRWLDALVGPDTRRRDVDSFAAGLVDAEPAVSTQEYELRQLDRFVRAGGHRVGAPTGRPDRLARGFEAWRGRIDTRFTRFDGNVGRGRVSAFDPRTPVSATRFETYAKCPRRYLFERVLRVSERVRPEELWRIEPITRGTLVHAILEAYVSERLDGAPCSLERLLAIAAGRLDEAERSGLVGKPLLWRMDRCAIERDLRRFHAEEGDLEPIAAELSFGAGGPRDDPPVTVLLDDGRSVAFRGSVDRVDRTSAGHLMVSDYKTGRQGRLSDLTRDPVAAGKLLQLPLYAMAARARFGGPGPVHARYWLLSSERSAPCFHLVVTDDIEARFRHVVTTIADGVENGCFPGVPGVPAGGRFSNCIGCDFDDVCPTSRDRQWGRTYSAPEMRGLVSLVNGDVPEALTGSVVKRFVDPDGVAAP